VSALKRANLLFLVGFDKGGVVDDDDGGEWESNKLFPGPCDSDSSDSRYWQTLLKTQFK
jgi:uncharacterized membrane-anchored protein